MADASTVGFELRELAEAAGDTPAKKTGTRTSSRRLNQIYPLSLRKMTFRVFDRINRINRIGMTRIASEILLILLILSMNFTGRH